MNSHLGQALNIVPLKMNDNEKMNTPILSLSTAKGTNKNEAKFSGKTKATELKDTKDNNPKIDSTLTNIFRAAVYSKEVVAANNIIAQRIIEAVQVVVIANNHIIRSV